jgi:hypothetical protein
LTDRQPQPKIAVATRRDFALLAATENKGLNGAPTTESTMMKSNTPQAALQAAEARYLEALNGFVSQAHEDKHMVALVEALTWTLARIAIGYGTSTVVGDILGRLGRHISDQSDRKRAQNEASKAREAGQLPH